MANYGYTGWTKLWRAEMLGPFYGEKREFSKWEAWLHLCMIADSEGTVKTSLDTLKNQWFWGSRHRVRDFLGTLEELGMGTVICTPNKGTLFRINTGFYGKSNSRKKRSQGTVTGTVNGNEETSLKEEESVSPTDITSPEEEKKQRTTAEIDKWRDLL